MLASLERQPWLPVALRLHIEEAVETAWEVAFRRGDQGAGGVIVSFSGSLARKSQGERDAQRASQGLSGALSQLRQAENRRPLPDPADNIIDLTTRRSGARG